MEDIKVFFDRYSKASARAEAEEVASFYAADFMVASKEKATTFKNDHAFIQWLGQVFEFNRKNGLLQIKVKDVQTSAISECYIRASVKWEATFAKDRGRGIDFDIHYILYTLDKDTKIVFYISEEDQELLMKKEGLL